MVRFAAAAWLALGMLGAASGSCAPADSLSITSIYATELGGPVQGLSAEQLAAFDRGRAAFSRVFAPSEGLGPNYNAVACVSCHFFPVVGGAASRFRDVHLLQTAGGEDRGTEEGPLRQRYSVGMGHEPGLPGAEVFARRAPLPTMGVGLYSFVPDDEILSRADPEDADGDGISGRPHQRPDGVGRYGYNAQAATLTSVVRGALREQMGLTTAEPLLDLTTLGWLDRAIPSAHAHPHNPMPIAARDDDAVPDPEVDDGVVADLVAFLTWLAPPPPSGPGAFPDSVANGERLFGETGCARCHVASLATPFGPIPAYTDLLLHDMGTGLAPEVALGDATVREVRTSPLLAIRLYVPYLHDSSAPAFEFTTIGHGGEAAASSAAYQALTDEGRTDIARFMDSLGGWNPKGRFLATEGTPVPAVGAPAGPDRVLTDWETDLWTQGRNKFDRMAAPSFNSGLGAYFNADTCRGCHFQPVIGGAGPNDVNVLVFDGERAPEEGIVWPLAEGVLPHSVIERVAPFLLPASAVVVEPRNSPTILGLGLLDRVPAAAILARHDPEDTDGDGISGRARILVDGRLGRFGWKANVPTMLDFVAGALRGEMGITVDPRFSGYTAPDDADWYPDPEVDDNSLQEEAFFLSHLAPPAPALGGDAAAIASGRALLETLGCAACHLPDLAGVPAYTDLLLHEVAPEDPALTNRERGVLPREFRTPPLWGLRDTGPYLHDGRAETLGEAITAGHDGEAAAARGAYEAASSEERAALEAFLGSL